MDYLVRLEPLDALPSQPPVPAWSFRDPGEKAPAAIRSRAVDMPAPE